MFFCCWNNTKLNLSLLNINFLSSPFHLFISFSQSYYIRSWTNVIDLLFQCRYLIFQFTSLRIYYVNCKLLQPAPLKNSMHLDKECFILYIKVILPFNYNHSNACIDNSTAPSKVHTSTLFISFDRCCRCAHCAAGVRLILTTFKTLITRMTV
jgi:hypothetical protein